MYRFLLISFLAVLWVRISLATNTGDPCTDVSDCQGKNAVCEDPGGGTAICQCPDGFTVTGASGNGDCEECNNAQDCADKGYGNKQDVTCVFKACQCETGFLQRPPSKTCVSAAVCAALTDPLNGGITYDPAGSPIYETTTATYSCNPSYTLVGTASTTCTISTDWSPNTAPVCTYECEQDLSVPTDGSVVYGADTLDGSEATYQCDSGFLLSGSPTATCSEASSGWVGTPPLCNQIIDGVWGTWESWGACDQTCGAGTQTRSRLCNDPAPANGGAQCAVDVSGGSESQACNDGACPVDGVWGTWESWGACDQTCGAGTQTRSRLCNDPAPANGGAQCAQDVSGGSESQACNDGACPVDGVWGTWENWGACDQTCGAGTQTRSRLCNDPAPANGGAQCAVDVSGGSESQACNDGACPVDGVWGTWENWGACDQTCGAGTQTRSRLCNDPAPANGGAQCAVDVSGGSESQACNDGACPVDGVWGTWESWGACDQTCGAGTQTRSRLCNDPAPANGGAQCAVDVSGGSESQACNDGACPVDGVWGTWENWGACDQTCGTGTQTRSRLCNDPAPANGGAQCAVDVSGGSESQACNDGACPVDGVWGTWESWGACDQTCGAGTQTRSRLCNDPAPANGGAQCAVDVSGGSESQACNDGACPVDGVWGTWENWGACDQTCGAGTQTRSRLCNDPAPANGGAQCAVDVSGGSESQACNDGACPVDGVWSTWESWGACDQTCGAGTQTRSRLCNDPAPANGGALCTVDVSGGSESQACNDGACPVDGVWGTWESWGACDQTCGAGTQTRSRLCNDPAPANGGAQCAVDVSGGSESRACNDGACPVDGVWGTWGSWGACDQTCGAGTQTRSRLCNDPAPANGGAQCAVDVSGGSESQACNDGACPVNGGWGVWGSWGACDQTCGDGTQTRSRLCNSPTPDNGGALCTADGSAGSETQSCNGGTCPVDGGFSDWSAWGSCSVTCGIGIQDRSRQCNNPSPQNEGADCDGDTSETQACDSGTACVGPVDGQFSDWSAWGSCSVTCGIGIQDRSRECNNPPPQNEGADCDGDTSETQACDSGTACVGPVDGQFSDWSAWGSCSVTCGFGIQDRSRECNNPPPQNEGADCDGDTSETQACDSGTACVGPVNGAWSDWEAWGACSLECGSGTQSRSRSCDNPPPSIDGLDCDGSDGEMQNCNTDACPVLGAECSTDPDLCTGDYVLCDTSTLRCGCAAGYIQSNGECLPVHGSDCSISTDCYGSYVSCNAESSTCDCMDGYIVIESIGQCYPELGTSCPEPPKLCYDENARCDPQRTVCICDFGFIDIDGLCRPVYGSDCTTVTDCYGTYVSCNADSSSCDCDAGYIESNGQCYPDLGESCVAPPYECNDEHASCDSTSTVCVCDSGFEEIDGLCRPVLGTDCFTETGLCYGDHVYCEIQSSTCACENGYIEYNGQCLPDCGVAPTVDYGYIIQYNGITTVGGTRTYACQTDYIMIGDAKIECLSTGSWTDAPSCKADIGWACQQNDDCIDEHTVCTNYCTCAEGYLHTSASQIRGSCQAGIDTSCDSDADCYNNLQCGTDDTCQCPEGYLEADGHCVAACSSIISIMHGSVNGLEDDPVVGSIVTFTCDEGYYLVGDSVLSCTEEQQWSNELPTCYILCNVYGNFIHGDVTVLHDPPYSGTIASFVCEDGYTLSGSSVTTCMDTGEWDSDAPACIRDCKVLTEVSNGVILTSNANAYMSIATYMCDTGTSLSGNGTRECMDNSFWSGEEPICIQDCPSLSQESFNGNVRTTNGYRFDSVATYRCSYGYVLIGDETRTCQEDSVWSGPVPTCVPGCSLVSSFDHGDVTTTNKGLTQTFYCNDGYLLVGPAVLDCVNGEWNDSQPQCYKICGNIGVTNAQQVPANAHAGQTISILCQNGYILLGESSVVCTSTGDYSPALPSCARECEPLEPPGNGFVVSSGNYAGQSATFSCNPGSVLGGESSVMCTESGQWSDDVPACINNRTNLPDRFTSCPSIVLTIDLFDETFTREEIIEAVQEGLLDGESEVANVSIADYVIQKMPNGLYRVQVEFECQLLDDRTITNLGIPFILGATNRFLTVSNLPLHINGTAEFSYGLQQNAPIITTCFWLQHRENCVGKGRCVMEENRQKCRCEETVCEPPSITAFIVLPAVSVFIMTLLCAGGCYTHPCVERKRKIGLEKRRETESVTSYYDILHLPRYGVMAPRPTMETIHETGPEEVIEIIEEEVVTESEPDVSDVRF